MILAVIVLTVAQFSIIGLAALFDAGSGFFLKWNRKFQESLQKEKWSAFFTPICIAFGIVGGVLFLVGLTLSVFAWTSSGIIRPGSYVLWVHIVVLILVLPIYAFEQIMHGGIGNKEAFDAPQWALVTLSALMIYMFLIFLSMEVTRPKKQATVSEVPKKPACRMSKFNSKRMRLKNPGNKKGCYGMFQWFGWYLALLIA